MLDQLERLPASAERDRMLREVRARVVDIDTGVAPSALPASFADKPAPAPDPPATVKRAVKPAATRRPQPAKPIPVSRNPARAPERLTVAADDVLSLDDASFPPGDGRTALVPAWRRGLRG